MLFDPSIVGRASGSLAGLTASHNRGGSYFRARVVPTNPNTPAQQTVRGAMSQLAALWSSTLTSAQRIAWETYALNVPIPNAFGAPINVGGVGMFIRTNVLALQTGALGGVPLVTAPSIFDLGEYTQPSITNISAATDQLTIAFTAADAWANEDGSAMLIYTSRPVGAAINYFKGPYRFAFGIIGDAITPPTSPSTDNLAFQVEVGQKCFVRARVIRIDGRVSAEWFGGKVVTT